MKKVLFTAVVLLLLTAFGVSAFMVGNYLIDGKKQEGRYDELSSIAANAQTETEEPAETTEAAAETTGSGTEETTEPTEPTEPGMLPGYKEIYEMNDHTVGWIKMEGTKMDYPVMQTPADPNFYLYRNFDKAQSARGCVYAWSEADINEPSDNITLFGHNMADGSMFACLNAYTKKEAWDNNSLIFFDTLTEYHTYKIFAAIKCKFAYRRYVVMQFYIC